MPKSHMWLLWLLHNLSIVSSKHPLKYLSLGVTECDREEEYWNPDWDHPAWERIDSVLQQDGLHRFCSLKIMVTERILEEFRMSLDKVLPASCEKGFIEVQLLER
ncbi:hypothetical protein DL96DRAFT_1557546 [Flagelloscypha sp. PMI_526]|nr:hypothetical protein DL96DRAFT_1557546 [Flagelloscypha sp. PMI_526]